MRNRSFLLLVVLVSAGSMRLADAAPNPSGFLGAYTLNGTTKVHVPLPFPMKDYNREFHPPLATVVTRGANASELIFTITRLGHSCPLKAVATSDVAVTFPAGQKCPAKIEEDLFTADLMGTLKSGSATLKDKTVSLVASWDVEGTVHVKGLRIPGNPKATMQNDASGTKPEQP